MILESKLFPDTSKIAIYPSSRKFYPQEIEEIKLKIEQFLSTWIINPEIDTSYLIKYDRFIIFLFDDSKKTVSLSELDASVNFIQSIEKEFNVTLIDKINVCYKQGDFVQYKEFKEFKKMIKNKSVSEKTIVFNNFINTKEELATNWEINILDSWLDRLF